MSDATDESNETETETATLILDPINEGLSFTKRKIQIIDDGKEILIGRKVNGGNGNSLQDTITSGIFDCRVVSRKHASIWYKNDVLFLRDLSSANGTYINDKQVFTSNMILFETQVI